jgi:hypothetical protein
MRLLGGLPQVKFKGRVKKALVFGDQVRIRHADDRDLHDHMASQHSGHERARKTP